MTQQEFALIRLGARAIGYLSAMMTRDEIPRHHRTTIATLICEWEEAEHAWKQAALENNVNHIFGKMAKAPSAKD